MNLYVKKIALGAAMVAVIAFTALAMWFLFFRSSGTPVPNPSGTVVQNSQSFTTNSNRTQTGNTQTTNGQVDTTHVPDQKIFKLADGPVMGATFVQTHNPTTTLARYVMQDSGHVFDIPVNVPGAIARVISNTTIPGLASSVWFSNGGASIIEYAEAGVIKTVYLGFSATSSAIQNVQVRFLPNGILGLAASPDGKNIVYLLPTGSGVTGYKANSNGTIVSTLFYTPLTQVLVSWPATTTILLQTKEATGVPGIAFSVSSVTGEMRPFMYAPSLSATANAQFSKVVYQTSLTGLPRTTYSHDTNSGKDLELPFNPLPEKCIWSPLYTAGLFCAAPLDGTPSNYLDLWHEGVWGGADSIFAFDIARGISTVVALPGGRQGGVAGDVAALAVSPDGQYLLFINKGDRTLWGVRLAQ